MMQERVKVNGFEKSQEDGEIVTTLYLADGRVVKGSESGLGKYKRITHSCVTGTRPIPDSGFLKIIGQIVGINYQLLDNTYVLIGDDVLTIVTYD